MKLEHEKRMTDAGFPSILDDSYEETCLSSFLASGLYWKYFMNHYKA